MGGGVRSSARLSGAGRAEQHAAARSAPVDAAARASAARAAAAERRARAAERAREVEDSPRVLRDKCRRLARALKEAKHLVVYTGAGISTAADIPDYRGPHGVWTRLQRGETVGRVEVARAQPTFTHMALTALWASGVLKFVVSQNCDGLHVRAGLPRRALAELHGDMFAEQCAACRRVYLRTFDTTERTARHAHGTRRLCHSCGRELRDTIVHFGERGRAAWPLNWAGALRHAAAADVVLCLGSSLKVLRRYPRLWRMQRAPHARPALYIVNLQWTPKDAVAALKINARCDAVMAAVARRLRLRVPRYSPRRDPLLAHGVPLAPLEAHTARRAPLSPPSPPSLDADSDSDTCYSLGSPSASPSPSPSPATSDAESEESDDSVPLGRLAERLRAARRSGPATDRESLARKRLLADRFRSFQVSMSTCEATILLRAEHAPPDLPPPEPPPAALAAATSASQFDIISPPRSTVADANSPLAGVHTWSDAATSAASASRALTGELRRFRRQRLAGAALLGHAFTNGDRPSSPPPDRNFNTVTDITATVKEEDEKSLANGAWPCGSKLRQLLEIKTFKDEDEKKTLMLYPPLEVGPRAGGEAGADGVDRKCKVQLPAVDRSPFSEIKSEHPGSCRSIVPFAETSGASAAGALHAERERQREREELGAAEAEAAAFIRRAVLVCRASLYPGLHTILGGGRGGRGARACAWCTRRYGARRCLWYGAPPDSGALRTARRVRGRRYLCACCPDRARSPHSPHAPLPDDAGWYGKGYRKGRRRRR